MTFVRSRPSRALERDADRLIERHSRWGIPFPAYGGRSLGNLPSTIAHAIGSELGGGPPPLPPLVPELDPFDGRRAEGPIVVVLLDGIGWYPLRRWAASPGERATRWRSHLRPLTSVFPTTTTTALTSLSTGTGPATHGLVGYRQYLPAFGVVADMLKFSPVGTDVPGLLVGPHWRPEHVSGAPTIFRRGVRASALSRRQFAGTGFTRLLYDGAEFVPYGTASDLAHELRRLLARPSPSVIFTYWDELDTIQHVRGPSQELFDLEIERFIHLLEFAAKGLPAKVRRSTTILLTGDHGQVPATPAARLAVESMPAVAREMARPLAGDRRAGLFAARPGRLPALTEALEAALPSGSHLIPTPDAVGEGLFGPEPYHPELPERIGDLLALVPSPAGLTYLTPGAAPPDRFLIGAHGGLEPEELLVPLVAGSLESLAGPEPTGPRRKR